MISIQALNLSFVHPLQYLVGSGYITVTVVTASGIARHACDRRYRGSNHAPGAVAMVFLFFLKILVLSFTWLTYRNQGVMSRHIDSSDRYFVSRRRECHNNYCLVTLYCPSVPGRVV